MAAQEAQLTSASVIKWSDDSLFNGFVVLTMNLPTNYTKVFLKDTLPLMRVPTQTKVGIREGVYDAETKVWMTNSLVPPGVTYSSVFYDSTGASVATGPSTFTVTTSPHTLAPPTLTVP